MKRCEFCNGEIKISKKGNEYCANICWEKEPYKSIRKKEEMKRLKTMRDTLGNTDGVDLVNDDYCPF